MAGEIKELNRWAAILGGAYFRAVRSEHHPAAVYAKGLAVVVASLAVAQCEEVDQQEKAKFDSLE